MDLTDQQRELLTHLIERVIIADRQDRFHRLIQSRKGVDKFRLGLCHFQSNLRLDAAIALRGGDWWEALPAAVPPRNMFVFGRRHCELMPFRQAKGGAAICSFVVDADRRFIAYLGDAGDHWLFLN